MNLGLVYNQLDKIDKMIIMSSLSWCEHYPSNITYVSIFENKEYNKLIFIDIKVILEVLLKEVQWVEDFTKRENTLNDKDPKEFHISVNNLDKIKRLIKLIKGVL